MRTFVCACLLALSGGVALSAQEEPRAPSAAASAGGFHVGDLKTDYRVNPLGVEARHLRFFWRVGGGDQAAWQVQAASSPENLAAGAADLWDSGKRQGAETTHIAYAGAPLAARQRAWWRVRAWDGGGSEAPWSAPAWFEMGLLGDAAWQNAPWIGCDRDFQAPEPAPAQTMGAWIEPADAAPLVCFFKDVALPDKPVVSAVAWWGMSKKTGPASVTANYDALKGRHRGPLARVMRANAGGSIDLAFFLLPGTSNRIELRFQQPVSRLAVTIGMKIVFADGQEMHLKSGEDWQVSLAARDAQPAGVKVAAAYGDLKFGEARVFEQTNLPPAWFRGTLRAGEGIRRARLYLCALGQGLAFVNGAPVSDELLAPPQSDYEAFAYYTSHDITSQLKPGANAISVLLDAGWYHQVGGFHAVLSYGQPGLKALAVVEYADGKQETFTAGPSWQWKEGAIRAANIYRGERIDFRRDHDEWKRADVGDGWKAARVIPPCTPTTVAVDVLPVGRGQLIRPVNRWQIGSKTWQFDMGEVLFGWVRFTMNEPADAVVRLRYSEYAADGKLQNVPLSQWWCHGATQGDEIVSDGKKRRFEPTFATKSFRYVEISGVDAPPEDLVGVPIQSTARPLATFESSDAMLNRLFQNGMRTWRNYVAHTIADVPRERCLWGAESIYSEVPGSYCYDYPTNHRLMLDLWCTGAMTPEGIPGNIGVGKRLSTVTSSFAWSVTPVFIASNLFEHFGDVEPSRPHYDLLRRILRHAEEKGERGGTIPVPHNIGDHAPPKDIPRQPASLELVNALVFFEAQRRFARIADALGKPEDAAHARAHGEKVRATIMGFYDRLKHTFGNGTHDSLALAYGAIDDVAEQKKLAASLAGWYRANGHQFDGGFMSYEIYAQLSRFGYADDALKMLTNTEPPGPARSVKVYDATTFWEAYYLDHDFQMNRGLNFIAYAHPIGWMLTDLAGIRFDPAVPGGRRLILAPAVPRSEMLDWVKATVQTMQGTVESAWKWEGGAFSWQFVIPCNVAGQIRVPADGADTVKGAEGLKPLGFHDGLAIYEARPGRYSITSRLERKSPPAATLPARNDRPRTAVGDQRDWKVAPGCSARVEEGNLIVTPGQGPTVMLTTALPSFAGERNSVRFRLKTTAQGVAVVRLVSISGTKKSAQTVEVTLGPTGAWQEYSVALPSFDGKPFSLWIGLAREKETLAFDEISLLGGDESVLKRWSFQRPKP